MAARAGSLKVTVYEAGGGGRRLSLAGLIDAHTCAKLTAAFETAFGEGVFQLIVDLARVSYISSNGVSALVSAFTTTAENDGELILKNPSRQVRLVFDLLGVTEIFGLGESGDG